MDGQTERMIQTLEDMLRACILNLKQAWEVVSADRIFLQQQLPC